MRNFEEKKVGVAGLQPTLISLYFNSFKTEICTTFCTANQSTKTNLRNFSFLIFNLDNHILFIKIIKHYKIRKSQA